MQSRRDLIALVGSQDARTLGIIAAKFAEVDRVVHGDRPRDDAPKLPPSPPPVAHNRAQRRALTKRGGGFKKRKVST